jgi:hypothetical protein
MAMIPTVLTCMFLSSPQPTESAAECRSDRVGGCLPHEYFNKRLLIHILHYHVTVGTRKGRFLGVPRSWMSTHSRCQLHVTLRHLKGTNAPALSM